MKTCRLCGLPKSKYYTYVDKATGTIRSFNRCTDCFRDPLAVRFPEQCATLRSRRLVAWFRRECHMRRVDQSEVLGRSRSRVVTRARGEIARLMRDRFELSASEVAAVLGRTQSTIAHISRKSAIADVGCA